MAVSMEAGTAVILTLSPPPIPAIFRRRFQNSLGKSSLFSGTSLSTRTSNLRIFSVSQRPSQGDFYGGSNDVTLTPVSVLTFAKGLLKFIFANLLPLALVGGAALGFTSPTLGCLAHKYSLSKFITCWLFFLSGLKSQDGDVKEVVEAWPAVLYGLASILLVCPIFSKLILKIRMVPQEFITGLAIFSCMPTTLNGGVALTQLVGGNSALALALTVISVLIGILTVPLWITKFVADGFGVTIPTWPLFQSLVLTLIVPLILGKVLRNSFPGMSSYVERNERWFSVTTSILLGIFPWMQVSKSRQLLLMVKPEVFVCAVAIGILVHLSFLVFNATLVRGLSVGSSSWKSVFEKQENRRALMLVCSQRSLLIATAVVEQLGGVLGESGLLLLPCVAADVNQIVFDSLLVNFWLRKDGSCDSVKKS
ncbi:probable sodium/metabolite cotransporter BASS4, chloroplastic isoform X2 [Beta vulgaris subsp. vulgaris]|uniref:probable sodium/metabolite cotransporter BASS4, chloroplastic isoform X2 n=1 Tax=Beta vulgaris subsp. vulgaris TaxID=3555 RepID=UPI0020369722|nr:probable sodium/metabolite cotransporter BASS4, chloroplastic isoform X2 [Beta vulgaris subsp. vulgaris]